MRGQLLGKEGVAYQERQEATLKARAESAKTAGQLGLGMKNMFFEPSKPGYFTEVNMGNAQMLVAKSPRLAGKTTVVGNTAFTFDAEGVCRKINEGHVLYDFELLCAQNGVDRLDSAQPAPLKAAAPAAAPKAEPEPEPLPDLPIEEVDTSPPDLVVPAEEPKSEEKSEKPKKKSRW